MKKVGGGETVQSQQGKSQKTTVVLNIYIYSPIYLDSFFLHFSIAKCC